MEQNNDTQEEQKTPEKKNSDDKNTISEDLKMNGNEKEPLKPKMQEELDVGGLKQIIKEKNIEIEDYQTRLLRAQAEFENYIKRADKEQNEFRIYANSQLVNNLLVILDDFQCALSAAKCGSEEEFLKGFELIYNNLFEMLTKEGLSIINPENEKFDPWKHEAVDAVPSDEHPEHTILEVIQPGYKFKDKILRPAKVRVTILPKENEDISKLENKKSEKDN
jgi:molecular chaperone GrpE